MRFLAFVFLVLLCGCIGEGTKMVSTTSSTLPDASFIIIPPAKPTTTAVSPITSDSVVPTSETATTTSTTLSSPAKTFEDNLGEICFSNGVPVVRMYSKSTCEHCDWSKPIYKEVVLSYGGRITAHIWEFGAEDDLLTPETEDGIPLSEWEYFTSVNPSKSVPFFSLGCRFTRVGNGYFVRGRPDLEKREYRDIIDFLLNQSTSS